MNASLDQDIYNKVDKWRMVDIEVLIRSDNYSIREKTLKHLRENIEEYKDYICIDLYHLMINSFVDRVYEVKKESILLFKKCMEYKEFTILLNDNTRNLFIMMLQNENSEIRNEIYNIELLDSINSDIEYYIQVCIIQMHKLI